MELEFIPLDYDSFDLQGRNYIKIYGKTSSGKKVCIIDRVESFFWIILEKDADAEKIISLIKKEYLNYLDRTIKASQVILQEKNFLSKKVNALKVIMHNNKDISPFTELLEKKGFNVQEKDINPVTRYIIEKNVRPLVWQKIKARLLNNDPELLEIDQGIACDCFFAEHFEESEKQHDFKPKVLAFDIESEEFEIGKGKIIMLSIASHNLKKVITWKKSGKKDTPEFVEYVKDEPALLERFQEYIQKEDPDIIVGYFSDGFDLPYIRARAEINKIKLNLGPAGSSIKFLRGGINSAKISGIVHIDLYKFIDTVISPNLQSETISLGDVASELLGEKKHDFDFAVDQEDLEKFYKYNLQDSLLTEKLFHKLWPNIQELCKIVQEPLFDICRDGYSQIVENYILHNLRNFNEIAMNKPNHHDINERRLRSKYEGALVKEPVPGLYENVAFFDFTSLYPSMITSFNISPATLQKEKVDGGESYKTPEFELNGKKVSFCFSKEKSFIPTLVHEIILKRKEIKQQLKENFSPVLSARSYALKTIMNATYGYYGFFAARYYSLECAASITAFGRYYIRKVIQNAEEQGFKVIYSDTDSISIALENKSEKNALDFIKKTNDALPGDISLELEDFYKRGIFVSKRTVALGAKKKYALINKQGQFKIRGFETVRRDWCNLAREVQNKIIKMILEEGNAIRAKAYIMEIINKVKNREIQKKEFFIKTQLKKDLHEYKSISPHVIIAQKMKEKGIPVRPGALIEYFIAETREKKALVRDKAKMPDEKGEYNIDYYLNHQIIPAVENIFEIFNINLQEISSGKKQKSLGDF